MQLSGTDVGGWNVIVEPYPFLENADWDPVAFVQGYDTGLGKTEIKRMLFNHFSSCGQIMDIEFHNSTIGVASVYLYGEGAEDKVLDLDGSYMGGCKILVKHIITNGIYTVHPRRRHYGWPRIRNFADKHENLSQVMIPATPNMVLIVICFSVCSL
ncbi:RNA-binding (RRM/RBD/RNP motifs) family protein [Raphanus sativus]|nr:RNA-binding (RRM/RBD/RNP motifs) family protein [Raphanus sativus]